MKTYWRKLKLAGIGGFTVYYVQMYPHSHKFVFPSDQETEEEKAVRSFRIY